LEIRRTIRKKMVNVKVKILVDDFVATRNKLNGLKIQLENVQKELKDSRKSDTFSDSSHNETLISLNKERENIKKEISEFKSKIKKLTDVVYEALDNEASNNYSKELDKLFSLYLDKDISTIYYVVGDSFFEETSEVFEKVVSLDKKQDGKVLKTIEYGLIDNESKEVLKKAKVRITKYVKKGNLGEVINGEI